MNTVELGCMQSVFSIVCRSVLHFPEITLQSVSHLDTFFVLMKFEFSLRSLFSVLFNQMFKEDGHAIKGINSCVPNHVS